MQSDGAGKTDVDCCPSTSVPEVQDAGSCSMIRFRSGFSLIVVLGLLCANVSVVYATVSKADMLKNYAMFSRQQKAEALPFTLISRDKRGIISASVSTFLPDIPYSLFVEQLAKVEEWCEFIPLHLNIKSCTFQQQDGSFRLNLYIGIKDYLTPDQASRLNMQFHAMEKDEVFLIQSSAKDGPYDSTDYQFMVRAIGVDEGVYLEFDFSSMPGYVARLAKIYFSTIARNKVGFSKVTTWTGKTRYIGGQRGAAERNVVRYLLAIKTYFSTLNVPENERYERRLKQWFDATRQYQRQLYEMDRETYLSIKRKERKNQFVLMESLKNNIFPYFEKETRKTR